MESQSRGRLVAFETVVVGEDDVVLILRSPLAGKHCRGIVELRRITQLTIMIKKLRVLAGKMMEVSLVSRRSKFCARDGEDGKWLQVEIVVGSGPLSVGWRRNRVNEAVQQTQKLKNSEPGFGNYWAELKVAY